MKRIGKLIVATAILVGLGLPTLAADVDCPHEIRAAIDKYKAEDYVGCIQDLEEFSKDDPTNAISYYYTGIAYMKVGMRDKAIEAFQKVATLNTVPILSSLAVQASNCMMTGTSPCIYKKYKTTEIEDMVLDPTGFFQREIEKAQQKETREEIPLEELDDIDRLIQGVYPENIHPDANKTIQETKLIQEQERVNAELKQRAKKKASPDGKKKGDAGEVSTEKLANVSDKEIADAVRTLNKAGYKFVAPNEQVSAGNSNAKQNPNPYKQLADYYAFNQDAAQMAMMFGSGNNRNDSFNQLLPFILMQEQENNNGDGQQRKINPELIKTMMMSSMMGDFDFNFDRDKNR